MSEVKARKEPFGRPTKYRPEYCQRIIDFFDVEPFEVATDKNGEVMTTPSGKPVMVPAKLPTFEAFAHSIDTTVTTLQNWCEAHEDFLVAKKRAGEIQKTILIQNGLTGGYNNTFAIFVGKSCLGMRDGNEADQQVKPTPIQVVVPTVDASKHS